MCGIAGIVHLRNAGDVDRAALESMAAALAHRGPDDFGFHTAPGIGLASRRLSIVGIHDGRQPVFNEDASVIVVFNGELFDHRERRADLQARGHRFLTTCDTEILPHLWEEYGESMVERLRGQFAFALFDQRRQLLILARDRVGIVPLHWAQRGDHLYFGSEIKAILASGCVVPEPDHRGIDHIFTFFAMGTRRTAFRGIQSVNPATYLRIDLGKRPGMAAEPIEHRYWDLRFPAAVDDYDSRPLSKLTDEFGRLLRNSVGLRLQADVPVVSYLSGGIDSALILQTAAESLGKPIPAFTVSVSAKGFDETSQAQEAAKFVGGEKFTTSFGEDAAWREFPELTIAAEAPVIDTACAAMLRQSREVRRQGYKVALSGEGADEWFAGYPWFKSGKLLGLFDGQRMQPSNLIRRLVAGVGGCAGAWRRIREIQDRVGGPNSVADLYTFLCMPTRQKFYSQEMWDRIGGFTPFEDLDMDVERLRSWHPLNRALYLGSKTILPGLLLSQKGDRAAMANSVEIRYPFLDEELIEFCAALPPHFKLRGLTQDKYLLRNYAERHLPISIARRRKRMFRAPMADALFRDSPPFVEQLLSEESLRRTGYFRADVVQSSRNIHQRKRLRGPNRFAVDMGLTGVIATQLWHHTFIGGGLCELPVWTPGQRTLRQT